MRAGAGGDRHPAAAVGGRGVPRDLRDVRADAVGPAPDHRVAAAAVGRPREDLPVPDPARHALPALGQNHPPVPYCALYSTCSRKYCTTQHTPLLDLDLGIVRRQ